MFIILARHYADVTSIPLKRVVRAKSRAVLEQMITDDRLETPELDDRGYATFMKEFKDGSSLQFYASDSMCIESYPWDSAEDYAEVRKNGRDSQLAQYPVAPGHVVIDQVFMLMLNPITASAEDHSIVALGPTRESLEEFLESESVECYQTDEKWNKAYRQGGPFEWFNPPTSFAGANHIVDCGTAADQYQRSLDHWNQEIGALPEAESFVSI